MQRTKLIPSDIGMSSKTNIIVIQKMYICSVKFLKRLKDTNLYIYTRITSCAYICSIHILAVSKQLLKRTCTLFDGKQRND